MAHSSDLPPIAIRRNTDLRISWKGLFLVFSTPALGGFLYGFDIGATSFALAMLCDFGSTLDNANEESLAWWGDFGQESSSGFQEGLFISAISLGALLGSHLVLFHLAARIGRRMELRLAAVLYMIGSLCNISSGTVLMRSWLGYPVLILGRILFGVGVGFVMHGAPIYMAEMAPSNIRGAIVSAKETVIVLGILVGYALGDLVATNNQDWTILYQLSFLFSIPMLFLTFVVPRSFRWLLLQPQFHLDPILQEEAMSSFQFLYNDNVTEELTQLTLMIQQTRSNEIQKSSTTQSTANTGFGGTLGLLFCDRSVAPALFVALGLLCFQEGSGQPAVLSYATVIFEEAGWGGQASILSATIMMCVSIVTVILVDSVGRKRLLQTCAAIMGAALAMLALGAGSIGDLTAPQWQRILVLGSMLTYIGSYQLGFGPITWLVVSEIFPSHVRGQASALAVEFKYICNFVIQFGVPVLQKQLGWRYTFALFGSLMAVAAFYFIPFFVRETKGLSLEQIEARAHRRAYNNNTTASTLLDEFSDDQSSHTSSTTEHSAVSEETLLLCDRRTLLLSV